MKLNADAFIASVPDEYQRILSARRRLSQQVHAPAMTASAAARDGIEARYLIGQRVRRDRIALAELRSDR